MTFAEVQTASIHTLRQFVKDNSIEVIGDKRRLDTFRRAITAWFQNQAMPAIKTTYATLTSEEAIEWYKITADLSWQLLRCGAILTWVALYKGAIYSYIAGCKVGQLYHAAQAKIQQGPEATFQASTQVVRDISKILSPDTLQWIKAKGKMPSTASEPLSDDVWA